MNEPNNIIEGLESTKFDVKGMINENVLTLDSPICISQGSFLQNNNQTILDKDGNPIYFTVGSTIKTDKYQLSGSIDPSGSIPSAKSIPLVISTTNPCPKQDSKVNGSISIKNEKPQLFLSNPPLYKIYKGYSLLSSSGRFIKDENENNITIVSGSELIYILSGFPKNLSKQSDDNDKIDYIIREP